MRNITGYLPARQVCLNEHVRNEIVTKFAIAEKDFEKPGAVDVLLGADAYASIMCEEASFKLGSLILQPTVFGVMVTGTSQASGNRCVISSHISTAVEENTLNLDDSLRRFWELESIQSNTKKWSPNEKLSEFR